MWCLLKSFRQVTAGLMHNLVNTFSPVITGGDIVHLAVASDVGHTIAAIVFTKFFFGEFFHRIKCDSSLAEGNI